MVTPRELGGSFSGGLPCEKAIHEVCRCSGSQNSSLRARQRANCLRPRGRRKLDPQARRPALPSGSTAPRSINSSSILAKLPDVQILRPGRLDGAVSLPARPSQSVDDGPVGSARAPGAAVLIGASLLRAPDRDGATPPPPSASDRRPAATVVTPRARLTAPARQGHARPRSHSGRLWRRLHGLISAAPQRPCAAGHARSLSAT